jgi:hypothetical protein
MAVICALGEGLLSDVLRNIVNIIVIWRHIHYHGIVKFFKKTITCYRFHIIITMKSRIFRWARGVVELEEVTVGGGTYWKAVIWEVVTEVEGLY